MGFNNVISKLKPEPESKFSSQAPTPARADSTVEKDEITLDDSPVKYLTWRSFILGLCVSMGGFIFGYSTGQISGFTTMEDFKNRFAEYDHATGKHAFSNVRNGLIVGLLSIGTMIGALVAAPIADRIGRKLSISFWALLHIVGIIVQIATDDKWYQVAMGRWVAGLGVGALSSVVPMYQSESAPRQVRGAMVSAFQLFVAFGIFISYLINYGTESIKSTASWRITMGIGFAWPLILGVGTLFLPESPRYAYRHGRVDEARQVMSKLYGVPTNHRVVAQEMQDMKQKLEEELAAGSAPWHEILTGPRMFYRTLLGITLQSLQQLTGANFIFYYGTSIFQGVGLSNPYVTSIILGAVNFGMTIPGLYVVEHYGRRNCLMVGAAWMFICFMIWASVGHEVLNSDPSSHPAGIAMIVFTCFFIVGFATTWGPIVWAICGEMYPFRYRAVCMGVATAANWTWNFLISFFTPFISSSIDFRYGYVFAACCFAAVLIVFFFVNETQGRTLEEVDTMYVLHVKPWKSAGWVPPEGIVADMHAPTTESPKEGEQGQHQHHEPAEIQEQ
ncbi:Major facilitator superfamily domain general substrate transporter [Penicillium alfredii]|uniref:Major facilitator superfamily domain general substrate transporter n=1 Tax=Penicillium alfredii TaxID=1506179 RepID=A0A9W9JTU6_9EURO|nr:Major facilitator superfamily domain general substrate transporter [Penicillium alfredii]KAJ5081809.1 Major facilitator superfamily domain general substrate transporter [Penicillium alfredii]